eukprot:g28876.t1
MVLQGAPHQAERRCLERLIQLERLANLADVPAALALSEWHRSNVGVLDLRERCVFRERQLVHSYCIPWNELDDRQLQLPEPSQSLALLLPAAACVQPLPACLLERTIAFVFVPCAALWVAASALGLLEPPGGEECTPYTLWRPCFLLEEQLPHIEAALTSDPLRRSRPCYPARYRASQLVRAVRPLTACDLGCGHGRDVVALAARRVRQQLAGRAAGSVSSTTTPTASEQTQEGGRAEQGEWEWVVTAVDRSTVCLDRLAMLARDLHVTRFTWTARALSHEADRQAEEGIDTKELRQGRSRSTAAPGATTTTTTTTTTTSSSSSSPSSSSSSSSSSTSSSTTTTTAAEREQLVLVRARFRAATDAHVVKEQANDKQHMLEHANRKLKQQGQQVEEGGGLAEGAVRLLGKASSLQHAFWTQRFDLLLLARILPRGFFSCIDAMLLEGGFLVFCTFVRAAGLFHPTDPADVLEPGELSTVFGHRQGYDIIVDRIDHLPDGRPVNSFVARKRPYNAGLPVAMVS